MKLVVLLFSLTSCASYVNNLHRQIDNEQRAQYNQQLRLQRQASMVRARRANPANPNPVTLSNTANTQSTPNFLPQNQRNYQPVRKRYNVNDLKDNSGQGSLWSGENSESFLFVTNNFKKVGDIVIVDVMEELKDQIQDELKRRFPEPKKRSSKKSEKKDEEETKEDVATTTPNDPEKVYDKISTSVVERINQDYLLLKGRKEVLFKDNKHYVEIQTVVSQKDINKQDTVVSRKLLEPKINVLR